MTLTRTAFLCLVSALAAATLVLSIDAATSGAHGDKGDANKAKGHALRHHGSWGKGLGGGVVHSEAVIAKKDGTFAKVVTDRGFVKAVSGDQLTVSQATKKAAYGEATIAVPAGSKVVVNGNKAATLANLVAGQKVAVTQLAGKVVVLAADVKAPAAGQKRR